jgi:hypothetical protein
MSHETLSGFGWDWVRCWKGSSALVPIPSHPEPSRLGITSERGRTSSWLAVFAINVLFLLRLMVLLMRKFGRRRTWVMSQMRSNQSRRIWRARSAIDANKSPISSVKFTSGLYTLPADSDSPPTPGPHPPLYQCDVRHGHSTTTMPSVRKVYGKRHRLLQLP